MKKVSAEEKFLHDHIVELETKVAELEDHRSGLLEDVKFWRLKYNAAMKSLEEATARHEETMELIAKGYRE